MGVVVPVGDASVSVIYTCGGQPKEITWGFGLSGVIDPIDGQQAADDIWDALVNDPITGGSLCFDGNMANTWHFQGVNVTVQDVTGPIVFQHLELVDGSRSIEVCPTNCSVLVRKNTSAGGRKNRGRLYFPPSNIAEVNIDAIGGIGGPELLDLQGQFDAFYTALGAADLVPCVHHSDGSGGRVITSFSVQGRIATQRRRMR